MPEMKFLSKLASRVWRKSRETDMLFNTDPKIKEISRINGFAKNSVSSSSTSVGEEPVVIAVMGVTGVGKSSFIRIVSGRKDVVVGDNLTSETGDVRAVEFFHKKTKYILIDTPGFDDTTRSDREITEAILTWLKDSAVSGTRLNGVVYLHRISDTRMNGSALKNFRMFRQLVGEDGFKNVVLATTFWEQVSPAVGNRREKELRQERDFWGGMLEKGAKIVRLNKTREAGLGLIEQMAGYGKFSTVAEVEMIQEGKSVTDTTAAREQKKETERLERELQAERDAARRREQARLAEKRRRDAERLKREREQLERRREEARQAELAKQKKLEEEARQRHVELQREQRERARREEERRQEQLARIAREREEAIERQKQRDAEIVRQRKEFQENYVCIRHSPQWPCDKCKGNATLYTVYYHCCFCDSDRYFHCGGCGNDCGEATHPYMGQRQSPSDPECAVM